MPRDPTFRFWDPAKAWEAYVEANYAPAATTLPATPPNWLPDRWDGLADSIAAANAYRLRWED